MFLSTALNESLRLVSFLDARFPGNSFALMIVNLCGFPQLFSRPTLSVVFFWLLCLRLSRCASRGSRLPSSEADRQAWAQSVGQDGASLLSALFEPETPSWLAEVPAVEILRRVWLQNYQWSEGKLGWRSSENIPPASVYISSPYDLDAHYSKKRTTSWVGFKVHLTETCEKDSPHLITHVETTTAPICDDAQTATIHEGLKQKELLPDQHLVDTGYVDAQLLHRSQEDFGIDLVGPTRPDVKWQAQQQTGFDAAHFAIDWSAEQATCPEGHTSISWTPAIDDRKNEVIKMVLLQKGRYYGKLCFILRRAEEFRV
jgi:transposase